MSLPTHIGPDELRAVRRSFGLTQKEFATRMEVNQTTISRWERGQVPVAPDALERLPHFIANGAVKIHEPFELGHTYFGDQWSSLIRYYRATRGITQVRLAELLYVEVSTISRWETGVFRPNFAQQRQLRDLIFKPLETSAQFARVRTRMNNSSMNMFMSMGRITIGYSEALKRLHRKHDYNIPAYAQIDDLYGGKMADWLDARWQAGFFRGDVARSVAYFELSGIDARRLEVYPLPIEDGRILTLGFTHVVKTGSMGWPDGKHSLLHNDELIG